MRTPLRCLFLLSMLPLVNSGCKKNAGPPSQPSSSITGSWELRAISGGMMPGQITYAPGNGNILTFSFTSYKLFNANTLVKTGQFIVTYDTTFAENVCLIPPNGGYTNRIDFSDSTGRKIFFEAEGDKLTFYSGCAAFDAETCQVYARIAPSQ